MRVVGLLRGVNLGPSRRLKMADLRAAVESLGHTDVETYLQSGNVVFTPAGRSTTDLGAAITAALRDAVGLDAGVLTRTGTQMAKIVAANPYDRDDPTKVVVTFLASVGLRILAETHERLGGSRRFAVVATGPVTARPIQLTRLDEFLALYPSVEAALTGLRDAAQ